MILIGNKTLGITTHYENGKTFWKVTVYQHGEAKETSLFDSPSAAWSKVNTYIQKAESGTQKDSRFFVVGDKKLSADDIKEILDKQRKDNPNSLVGAVSAKHEQQNYLIGYTALRQWDDILEQLLLLDQGRTITGLSVTLLGKETQE